MAITPSTSAPLAARPRLIRRLLSMLLLGVPLAVAPAPPPRVTAVDSTDDVGQFTAIAIGIDGRPVVSYFDATNFQFKVAHCNDAACANGAVITVLDSAGEVGRWSSIAIGGDGLPVMSYYDASNMDLKVAHCTTADCSAFTRLTVDSVGIVGQFSSIAIGADGLPLVAYTAGVLGASSPKIAKCSTADCSDTTTITPFGAGAGGQHTSIAIGTDGLAAVPHVVDVIDQFRILKCTSAACTTATSATLSGSAHGRIDNAVAIGNDGFPIVSYYLATAPILRVRRCASANCLSGSFTGGTVDATVANVGAYNDIAIGTDGLPVMSYWDFSTGTLKVARCADAACVGASTLNTLDGSVKASVGAYTSIAIGADGFPVVSYYDTTNGDLKVAKCFTRTCEKLFDDGFE